MPKANKVSKPSPGAFLNMAREYHSAANTLFPIAKDVTSPIYFLYAHTLELTFKAYLGYGESFDFVLLLRVGRFLPLTGKRAFG